MKNAGIKINALTFLVAIFLSLASALPQLKESNTDFGKYKLECTGPAIHIDGQALKTYHLTYDNFEQDIQIGILKTKKCKNFIVRTSCGFEVLYICDKKHFGVNKMEEDFSMCEKSERYKIDRSAYLHQRVITTKQKTNDQLLELIACYLPLLIDKA